MGMQRPTMIAAGITSLAWLMSTHRSHDGSFARVGSNGFHARGTTKARFDQQPVEACGVVSACLAAGDATGDARWAGYARWAFDWFLGRNDLRVPLYDASTGGCRDGLHADRTNENQGAESTISFLQALLDMRASQLAAARTIPQQATA
jgi:hypothetical protein